MAFLRYLPGRRPAIKICPKDKSEYEDDVSYCPKCGTLLLSGVSDGEGDVVGGVYRILEEIGRGWAGVVYKAEHTMMGRPTALKVISSPSAKDPSFMDRFREAAEHLNTLDHPSIAMLHDMGVDTSHGVYTALEFVSGRSLKALLEQDGPLAPQRFLDIMRPVLVGVASAHEQGVVHGSLKPANIIVPADASRPKLVDFAARRIVAALGDDALVTRTPYGPVYGEVAYLAPEQIKGRQGGACTDIYCLGLLMYEALTGRRPFPGTSAAGVVQSQVDSLPRSPRDLKPQLRIPKFIDRAVMDALAKDPDERPDIGALIDQMHAEIVPEAQAAPGVRAPMKAVSPPPRPVRPPAPEKPKKTVVDEAARTAALRAVQKKPFAPEGPRLERHTGKGAVSVLKVDKAEMTIGRSPECDLVIDDRTMSRVHARIITKGDRIVVEDLDSLNGTYINNDGVKRGHIEDGDRVSFGNVVLIFRTT